MRSIFLAIVVLASVVSSPVFADILRLGALKFGTVNWELKTIKREGFDTGRGFDLQVGEFAGDQAAKVAFMAGEMDAIVSDWIWVARQRAAGQDIVFIPYSKAVGSLMVASDSPIQTLSDLVGTKIGIAGGPLDKSWLILQAYAAQELGMDLKAATEQVFGAPPLIYQTALIGETDASINFWHMLAKMEVHGFRPVISVAEAARELGLDPEMPLLGYVLRGDLARANPKLVTGFVAASRDAKALLARDDTAWDKLRDSMNAANDAEFAALVAGFRAGIPNDQTVDIVAAKRFFDLMVASGGSELVGEATHLPDGVFYGN